MKDRKEIIESVNKDYSDYKLNYTMLEVLLDIREQLDEIREYIKHRK